MYAPIPRSSDVRYALPHPRPRPESRLCHRPHQAQRLVVAVPLCLRQPLGFVGSTRTPRRFLFHAANASLVVQSRGCVGTIEVYIYKVHALRPLPPHATVGTTSATAGPMNCRPSVLTNDQTSKSAVLSKGGPMLTILKREFIPAMIVYLIHITCQHYYPRFSNKGAQLYGDSRGDRPSYSCEQWCEKHARWHKEEAHSVHGLDSAKHLRRKNIRQRDAHSI